MEQKKVFQNSKSYCIKIRGGWEWKSTRKSTQKTGTGYTKIVPGTGTGTHFYIVPGTGIGYSKLYPGTVPGYLYPGTLQHCKWQCKCNVNTEKTMSTKFTQ
uniref:Uncharacterized protein n=1 Tax=Cacopsylla melanoneura TaxID=428564 RepID=A0A8D9ENM0_9HEMI